MPIYNARTTAAMSRIVQRIEAAGGTVLSVCRTRNGWEVNYGTVADPSKNTNAMPYSETRKTATL